MKAAKIRLLQIEDEIAALTKNYKTAVPKQRREILKQYHALNQEHCNIRQSLYKLS